MAATEEHDLARPKGRRAAVATSPAREAGSLAPVTPRGEATKRRILDAAEAVFGELGYYEASVAEITRRAGVAQGTFYIYFHSKREIFAELVEDLGNRLRDTLRAAAGDITDRLAAERRGFAAFFAFISEHRQIYNIIHEAERVAPEAALAYYQRLGRGYERGLRAAMEAGTVRRMNPEAVVYALMGIGHFVALRWLIWPTQSGHDGQDGAPATTPELPPEIFEAMMEFINHALACDDGR